MKFVNLFLTVITLTILWVTPQYAFSGKCDYPNQLDSIGRRCGGRAASVRPGGRLGGDGKFKDSYGRDRIYGRNNDPYDKPLYQSETVNGLKKNIIIIR